VGDQEWEKWMAIGCKPFTMATAKYLAGADIGAAWQGLAA